ncbi:MAG: hypothetical protein KGJ23_05425 [Euryarchaeota archaeon]|nr:hypothetical protein [Euryarchaeota archaeon]MDE1836038.1 hypothetical protein [Euryarchaeota archaeon]MDE1881230.1 hypothetical protein [Euryarchaeota archaeon]MDE2044016.1 hypothetical protein [Thermoplasmata archaeon]
MNDQAPEACPHCGGSETVRDTDDYVYCYACEQVVPLTAPTWWYAPGAYCRVIRHRPGEGLRLPALLARPPRPHGRTAGPPVPSAFLGRRPAPNVRGSPAPSSLPAADADWPKRRSQAF